MKTLVHKFELILEPVLGDEPYKAKYKNGTKKYHTTCVDYTSSHVSLINDMEENRKEQIYPEIESIVDRSKI